MHTSYLLFAAAAGWCGTLWPGWILEWLRHHHPVGPPDPDPGPWSKQAAGIPTPQPARQASKPEPDPWRQAAVSVILGVLGGVGGAIAVGQAFPSEVSLVTVSIGALVGGRVLSNIYGIATVKSSAAQA